MILAATDRVPDRRAAAVLARAERRRAARLGARRRVAYVQGRALCRTLVGGILDVPAAHVPLGGADGRPCLPAWTGLDAGIAHAAGLSVAVAAPGRVGIDAIDRRTDPARVPDSAVSPMALAAVAHIATTTPAPLLVWAATEAALKAAGTGLTVPLGRLAWAGAGADSVAVDGTDVGAGAWHVTLAPTGRLLLAVARPAG